MPTATFQWITPPSVLADNLATWEQRILQGLHALADEFASLLESQARANAPWHDQTGEARASLRGLAVKAATSVILYLIGGSDHSLYLETGTRFMAPRPIIMPTLEQNFGPLMARVRALVGG